MTTATFPSKRPDMPGSVARMRIAKVIHCVDAHAEGEPSRIIVGGVLDVPGTTMLEKARALERDGDWLRRLVLFEPRGSAPLSADLVLPSAHPEADAGFIIMESSSYEGMSGTNAINTAAVLLETGMVEMVEPVTTLTLEAPAGLVRVTRGLRRRARRADHVRERAVVLHGVGRRRRGARTSARWPSTWPTAARSARSWTPTALGFSIVPDEARDLGELGERIRPHVAEQLAIAHPVEDALAYLSFVVFVAPPRVGGDARHATIVSPGRLDRSPTGTATSARIAVLDARGEMGSTYVAESVIDTTFSGRIVGRAQVGELDAVVPAITGRAWITGFHQLVVDPTDPLAGGFKLPDTWGAGRARGRAQPLNADRGKRRGDRPRAAAAWRRRARAASPQQQVGHVASASASAAGTSPSPGRGGCAGDSSRMLVELEARVGDSAAGRACSRSRLPASTLSVPGGARSRRWRSVARRRRRPPGASARDLGAVARGEAVE